MKNLPKYLIRIALAWYALMCLSNERYIMLLACLFAMLMTLQNFQKPFFEKGLEFVFKVLFWVAAPCIVIYFIDSWQAGSFISGLKIFLKRF